MANPNPKTEQLALGRGKRPKIDNETVSMRMSLSTRRAIEEIAYSYNCIYGDKPWIAGLLEKIASGQLTVVPTPPSRVPVPQSIPTVRQSRREHIAKKLHASSAHSTE